MSTSTCAKCGARVLVARYRVTGVPCIVGADPDPAGNVRLHPDGTADVMSPAERDVVAPELIYRSHYASCPFALDCLKRKGAAP